MRHWGDRKAAGDIWLSCPKSFHTTWFYSFLKLKVSPSGVQLPNHSCNWKVEQKFRFFFIWQVYFWSTSWNPVRLNYCKFIPPLKIIQGHFKWWQRWRYFLLKLQNFFVKGFLLVCPWHKDFGLFSVMCSARIGGGTSTGTDPGGWRFPWGITSL